MEGYIKLVAVMQKFVDQAISGNTSYNPHNFGGQVAMSTLLRDFLMEYKYGWKTGYYHNTFDGKGDEAEEADEVVAVKGSDCGDSCTI